MPASAASKALDEVTVLYSWDRPALFSPVKSARKSEQRLGNTVFLVTKLPATLSDLPTYLGVNQTKIKPRVVGELKISLHILNTRTQNFDDEVVQVKLY